MIGPAAGRKAPDPGFLQWASRLDDSRHLGIDTSSESLSWPRIFGALVSGIVLMLAVYLLVTWLGVQGVIQLYLLAGLLAVVIATVSLAVAYYFAYVTAWAFR